MSRSTMMLLWSLLVLTAGFLLALDGCGGSGGSNPLPMPRPSSGKIQHVVVIFQENRTPDNLFHGLPNADIANSGLNSKGQTIPLVPISLVTDYDLGHTHVLSPSSTTVAKWTVPTKTVSGVLPVRSAVHRPTRNSVCKSFRSRAILPDG